MRKRDEFQGMAAVVKTAAKAKADVAAGGSVKDDPRVVSAVGLKRSAWRLLRRVAEARSVRDGGRLSMAEVIASLIEKNREELEAEAREVE